MVASCKPTPESSSKVSDDVSVSSAEKKYEDAKKAFLENPKDATATIWYGRRTAYLGRYEEAIEIYTQGIQNHPSDARLYRHRGHRYISTRNFDKAINDFEKAVTLIKGQSDEVEPDGLPNHKNIPLTTLHGNIYYHLGLAYYLKNDLQPALDAFSMRSVSEKYDDNLVSGGHWKYMILRKLGRDEEAAKVIQSVNADMDIIENMSYHKMCLFYKGSITEEDLVPVGDDSAGNDVFHYGLGNWNLYHKKDTVTATSHFKKLLDTGNPFSFATIAAEADLYRLERT